MNEPTPEQLAYERGFQAGFAAARKADTHEVLNEPLTEKRRQELADEIREARDKRKRERLKRMEDLQEAFDRSKKRIREEPQRYYGAGSNPALWFVGGPIGLGFPTLPTTGVGPHSFQPSIICGCSNTAS